MNATTQQENARVAEGAGSAVAEVPVDPLSNITALRLRRDMREGDSYVGIIATGVERDLSHDAFLGLRDRAFTGGVDFLHRFANRTFALQGWLGGSHIGGSPEAMRRAQHSSVRYYQRPRPGLRERRPEPHVAGRIRRRAGLPQDRGRMAVRLRGEHALARLRDERRRLPDDRRHLRAHPRRYAALGRAGPLLPVRQPDLGRLRAPQLRRPRVAARGFAARERPDGGLPFAPGLATLRNGDSGPPHDPGRSRHDQSRELGAATCGSTPMVARASRGASLSTSPPTPRARTSSRPAPPCSVAARVSSAGASAPPSGGAGTPSSTSRRRTTRPRIPPSAAGTYSPNWSSRPSMSRFAWISRSPRA